MGLTTWQHAPQGKIQKSDVAIAKNYLTEKQLSEFNRIVSAYLELAENRARRHIVMTMQDWAGFLDRFLALSEYPILEDAGRVSALEAKLKAETEFAEFRVRQDREYVSDFDREVARLTGEGENDR